MSDTAEAERSGSSPNDGDAVRKAFSVLPLEEKISTLLRIELDLMGDAANVVFGAVSKVADEVVDAFAGSHGCESGDSEPSQQTPAS